MAAQWYVDVYLENVLYMCGSFLADGTRVSLRRAVSLSYARVRRSDSCKAVATDRASMSRLH